MSQICRYYLKGICKYGSRCHFLHENIDSSGKENYSGYSSGGFDDQYYTNKTSHYNKNTNNYSRYHVDNRRYNQTDTKSPSVLTEEEILDVIKQEVREFEERHIWFLTVIAPLKDLGNIPGLVDFSPEEMRYQYYESCSSSSLQDFIQSLNIVRNNIAQVCQIFNNKSKEAYAIVRKMVQKSGRQDEDMVAGCQSNAASMFKFDLNSLPKPSTFTMQSVLTPEIQFSKIPADFTLINDSTFSFGDSSRLPSCNNSINYQSPSTPTFGSDSVNDFTHLQNSAINSFSFSLNKLQSNQNAQPSVIHNSLNSSSVFNNQNTVLNSSVFDNPNPNMNTLISDRTKTFVDPIFNSDSVNNRSSVFGNQISVSTTTSNSVFSKFEEISSAALAAFQAESFKIGFIPLVAPSEELCFN